MYRNRIAPVHPHTCGASAASRSSAGRSRSGRDGCGRQSRQRQRQRQWQRQWHQQWLQWRWRWWRWSGAFGSLRHSCWWRRLVIRARVYWRAAVGSVTGVQAAARRTLKVVSASRQTVVPGDRRGTEATASEARGTRRKKGAGCLRFCRVCGRVQTPEVIHRFFKLRNTAGPCFKRSSAIL